MWWNIFHDNHIFSFGIILCGSNTISHFSCEYSAILSLSCYDPYFSQTTCLVISIFSEACSHLIIFFSYLVMIVTIIQMPSTGGVRKPFSTCASQRASIIIVHEIILLLYCVPNAKSSWLLVKVGIVFFTLIIPMLDPLIYSLRNENVRVMARSLINSKLLSHSI